MKKKTLFSLFMMFVSLTSWAQTIRLHANYPEYNKRQGNGSAGITVPSDNKTDWAEGDMIFFTIDGGDANKGFKATYDGATWTFAEWYKNGGMQDFNPAGGTISFAMNGENLNLATMRPSNLDVSKTALQVLSSYAGGKVGDIMFDKAGTYTVDENGDVDIFLNFTRPMAKIHINGAYIAASQIRNQIEGTMPGGVDNAGGTNANYNKSKTMTLGQIVRYQPSTQSFRDANSGNSLNGTANMVYMTRPEDPQVIDAVYYGNMAPDENGDLTLVMCVNARTYPGIEANAALGNSGHVAYWRKFPGMTINPNDDIYIYGPLSEEEGHLWTSQAITGEMNFTYSQLTLAENQQVALRPYCKWKAPAPKDRTLKFEISNPDIISISEDGDTLYTHGIGTSTITATTIDGYSSTMMVNVKYIQELIDVSQSTWGSSYSSNNVGWIFRNNTTADLTVTRVVMMVPNASGDYEEVASAGDLNILARSNNGTASGTLKIKDENVKQLSYSKLRITYTYNGKSHFVEVAFAEFFTIIHETNFPDENFRNWLLKQDYGTDGILTDEEIDSIASIDVSSMEIKSLRGIEYFTALTKLAANSNQLTALDVSKNTALTWLEFNSNQVASLDVSKNTKLTYLRCSGNNLTSVDVSKNTALTALYCGGNPITSVDVSKNTALKTLYCHLSKLTSLDLSKNTELTTLRCDQNQIKNAGMDALVESLPTVSRGYMYVIYNENEGNVMTTTQVAAARAKGWIPAYHCSDNLGWKAYGGYSPSMLEKFPDPNFCNYLLCQSYGADGDISDEEFANITSMNVNGLEIKSLQGIEYFTALTSLACYNNLLTSLDVSKNTALKELDCDNNQLISLDVSGCSALNSLYCYKNQLTSLDVSGCTELASLSCYNNQLTSLDVSGCTALTSLSCSSNQLTSLGVSNNTALTELSCNNNQLTSLDISKNTALVSLSCSDNPLTSLDVSKNTALTSLYCSDNQLTSLDVSKNTALTGLYCSDNRLTSLDVSNNTALTGLNYSNNQLKSLDLSKNMALTRLHCSNNYIREADMDALVESLPTASNGRMYILDNSYSISCNRMTVTQVAAAKAKGWTPYQVYTEYAGYDPQNDIEINEENFPDKNFRNYLLTQRYGSDGFLEKQEIAEISYLSLWNKDIKSLKGIEFFTALTYLSCYDQQLTSLDLSKNIALTSLYCPNNQLTSLDVSRCTALTRLICGYNKLTSLDISNNTALTELSCNNNQLTSLDISKNTHLASLSCSDNLLTSLDVSKNTALTRLNCYNNKLTSLDISNNTALTELSCNYNQLTSLDVSKNTALTYLSCEKNQLTFLDISKNIALTRLYCSNNQLSSIDVSNNTELTSLSCGNNQLTSLDLSNNTVLTYLSCENNQLTSLDLSKNTKLLYLYIFCNQIKDTSMDALVESLPTISSGIIYALYRGEDGTIKWDFSNEATPVREELNNMTTAQVTVAKEKGWTPYYYDGNNWLEYTGNELSLHGDVNGDGVVNGTDIQVIINLIVDGEYDEKADVNDDGIINGTDIQEVINIIVDGQ